jgi:hypothetical protein
MFVSRFLTARARHVNMVEAPCPQPLFRWRLLARLLRSLLIGVRIG